MTRSNERSEYNVAQKIKFISFVQGRLSMATRCGSLMVRVFLIIMFTAILLIGSIVQAKEIPFTQEDRDRLIRLEVTLKEFKESVDKRFEQIDKRFEQVDKRFEQVDKRFEQFGKQIDQLFNFLWIFAVIFTSITVTTIGFAIWDRRSMIRPFETRVKELEEGKIEKVISSLRTLAETDTKLAEALRQNNLL